MRHRLPLIALFSVAEFFFLASCGVQLGPRGASLTLSDYKLEIKSNTLWTAVVDGSRAVDGELDETIDLQNEARPVCATVTKRTVDGYIRARINPGGEWVETDEPVGKIDPCSGG